MLKSLRVGIIGVGHFGYFHAQKAKSHPLEHLIGVYDLDFEKALSVAKEFEVSFFKTKEALFANVDAVMIATPASTHFDLAKQALESGKHVFLEKPLAIKSEEGGILLSLAKQTGKVFQVGHLLNFSLSSQQILRIIPQPTEIIMRRSVPFSERGCDVSVILDLMIHDLELLFSLMGEKGRCLEASGKKYKTAHLDEVSAKFIFENGCCADLFASRAAFSPERFLWVKGDGVSLEANFITHELFYFEQTHRVKQIRWEKKDLLRAEHDYFAESCLFGKEGLLSVESAYQALRMANILQEKITGNTARSA